MKTDSSMKPPFPSLGAQLDHLLLACWLPVRWSTRIWLASELSLRLERSVLMLPPHVEWRAYSDGLQIYCAVGQRAAGIAYKPPGVALEVYFLDGDACVYAGGVWEYERQHGWRISNVIDVNAAGPSSGVEDLLERSHRAAGVSMHASVRSPGRPRAHAVGGWYGKVRS